MGYAAKTLDFIIIRSKEQFATDINNVNITLSITRRQNFRLVQIETNCRRHFQVHLKWKISTMKGRKHCEKR